MAQSYYKTIKGVQYDREMFELAEEAVAGQGDGRISVDDAKKLFKAIIDGNTITETEQRTLDYIKENFKFTDASLAWLEGALEAWNSQKAAQAKAPVTRVVETKQEATPPPQVEEKRSMVLPALVVVLIILLPIAYFFGKSSVTVPDQSAQIASLEQQIVTKEQSIKNLTEEIDTLKRNQAQQQAVQAQTEAIPAVKISAEQQKLQEIIKSNLQTEIASSKILFDQQKIQLTLNPNEITFIKGKTELTDSAKELLNGFFPKLVSTLKSNDLDNVEIQFQGHSSSGWKNANSEFDGYLKNLDLSMARAEVALDYCLNLNSVKSDYDWLNKRLVVSGFSDNQPLENLNDPERSRRITIAINIAAEN